MVMAVQFDATTVFRSSYQRNNKKGGQKNLRCFPNCCQGLHAATGFCGGPVGVVLEDIDPSKTYLLLAEFVPMFKGAPQATLTIGRMYSLPTLHAQANKDADPLQPYFAGHKMQSAYYFNPSKKGWHYGWMSNKHASDREHVLLIHVLEEVDTAFAQVLVSVASPPFTVHCRRRSKADLATAGSPVTTASPTTSAGSSKKRPLSPAASLTSPSSPSSDEDASHTKRRLLATPSPEPTPTPLDDDESLGIDILFQEEVLELITSSAPPFSFGNAPIFPDVTPTPVDNALWDTVMDDDETEMLDVFLPAPSAPPLFTPRYRTYFAPQRNAATPPPPVGHKRRPAASIPIDLKHPHGPPPREYPAPPSSLQPPHPPHAPPPAPEHSRRCRRDSSDASPISKPCCLLWSIVQLAFCATMFVHFVGHIFFPTYNAFPEQRSPVAASSTLTQYLVDCPPPSTTCVRDGFGLRELVSCVTHIADRCAEERVPQITMYYIDGNTTQLACAGMGACASQLAAFVAANPKAPAVDAHELAHRKEHYHREQEHEMYWGMQYKFVMFMAMCTLISFLAMTRSYRKCIKRIKGLSPHPRRLHPDDHIA
ncbi:hypothetical protein ACHHYP_09761 [Achlya hypogyna]|uniref:Transmembrane protein n=1 Tax=Achlya hypogyna TaxID=1202772 RepID=A0A1V9YMD1_ACHHY|nr:hypothetical protein ACHHYP_09761 [Achlya hypogyna]